MFHGSSHRRVAEVKLTCVCVADLMKLKRTQVKSGTGRVKKADALISKNAGGLCFSFNPRDSNV